MSLEGVWYPPMVAYCGALCSDLKPARPTKVCRFFVPRRDDTALHFSWRGKSAVSEAIRIGLRLIPFRVPNH